MSSRPGPLGQRIVSELRAEMGRQNRSRRWMAEQIGCPHNTVARWIAGDSNPGADHLDAMCRALGFTLADLVVAVQTADPRFRGHGRRTSDRLVLRAA